MRRKPKKVSREQISNSDAVMAASISHGQYSGQNSNIQEQVNSFKGWNYLGIAPVVRLVARAHVEIYDERKLTADKKTFRERLRHRHGAEFKAFANNQDIGEPVAEDFRWWELLKNPNPWHTGRLFRWDIVQQMRLHGMCMVWNVPNGFGKTGWRIVIPMAMLSAIQPGYRGDFPMGGIRVNSLQSMCRFVPNSELFESSLHYAANREIPMEQLSKYAYPHPYLRGDGFSPTDATTSWRDVLTVAQTAARKQYGTDGSNKKILWTPTDPNTIGSPDKLDAYQKRFDARIRQGDYHIVVAPAGETHDISIDPDAMAYDTVEMGYGRLVLAGQGTSEAAANLQQNQTYGANAAAMSSFATNTVQSDLDILGGCDSKTMQAEEGPGRTIEYTAPTFDDPELNETQNSNDIDSGSITVDEYRIKRGHEPFGGERGQLAVGSDAAMKWGAPKPDPVNETGSAVSQQNQRSRPTKVQVQGVDIQPAAETKSMIGKNVDRLIKTPPPVFAFDLDGTLAEDFEGEYDPTVIGLPNQGTVEVLRLCKAAGLGVVIYTARDNDQVVADWLNQHDIPWDGINENPWAPSTDAKMMAHAYIDDRAIAARTTEGVMMTAILESIGDGHWREQVSKQIKQRRFDRRYQFFCLPIGGELGSYIESLQKQIKPEHLAGDGIISELHITVLYGVLDADSWEVSQRLSTMAKPQFKLHSKPTVFGNDTGKPYALVVEVDGEDLHHLHANVAGQFAHINTFPVYRPHITLGYVAPEHAAEYESMKVEPVAAAGQRLIFRVPEGPDLVLPLR